MKIFICGHGRHGKDTVAEILRDEFGLSFESSSFFCAEKVVRPYLEERGKFYDSVEECYEDRHNHRIAWYEAIKEYGEKDKTRLSREIFNEHDIYVGIRDREEFLASRDLADLSIWVNASSRIDFVDPTCKILESDCTFSINNDGTLEELKDRVKKLFLLLGLRPPIRLEATEDTIFSFAGRPLPPGTPDANNPCLEKRLDEERLKYYNKHKLPTKDYTDGQ